MFSNPSKPKASRKTPGCMSGRARKAGSDFSKHDKAKAKRPRKENTPFGSSPRVRTSTKPAGKRKTDYEQFQIEPNSSNMDALELGMPSKSKSTPPEPQPDSQDISSYKDKSGGTVDEEEPESIAEKTNSDNDICDKDRTTADKTRKSRLLFVRNRLIRMKMEGSWNTLRENLANEADVSPIDHANRTMMGLLMDRELDITRNIIMNGDSSYGRVTNTNKSALRRFNNLVLWPATDLYRYLNDFPLGDFKAMGIYPQDTINQKYECISVEEPGDELDSQRINLLYDGDKCDPNACDSNESNRNGEDGYTGKHDVSADVDPITDPTLNGGIGLVIKRVDDPNVITGTYCDDNVQILTRKHVMDPWLLAPRYCRVPLQDAVLKDDTINDSCAKQLIDMTRAQVLNQVLAHRARTSEPVSPEPLPLAKFVSSMVAEEAVGGISRTWSKMNEMLLNGVKSQSAPQPCPGTATTQWFSILEAALAADLPPEVVARSYRRLEKLCDIIPKGKSNGMASIATNSESYNQRKYPSRRLDNATDIPS